MESQNKDRESKINQSLHICTEEVLKRIRLQVKETSKRMPDTPSNQVIELALRQVAKYMREEINDERYTSSIPPRTGTMRPVTIKGKKRKAGDLWHPYA